MFCDLLAEWVLHQIRHHQLSTLQPDRRVRIPDGEFRYFFHHFCNLFDRQFTHQDGFEKWQCSGLKQEYALYSWLNFYPIRNKCISLGHLYNGILTWITLIELSALFFSFREILFYWHRILHSLQLALSTSQKKIFVCLRWKKNVY